MYLADDFRGAIAGFDRAELEGSTSLICGLRRDLTLAFRNVAWTAFGEANDGPPEDAWDDRPVIEAISGPPRIFYADLFRRVQAAGLPVDHAYACPSPERFRRFLMRVVPVEEGGLLLVHHLVVDRPHLGTGAPPLDERYAVDGVVTLCSHCRRARRADDPHTWDWVPHYLRRGAVEVSHGLCPICLHLHYEAPVQRRRHAVRAPR